MEFVEYDVEKYAAYEYMLQITGGIRTPSVIVEEGKLVQVGWMEPGCFRYPAVPVLGLASCRSGAPA